MKLWNMSRTEVRRLFGATNTISTLFFSALIMTIGVATYIRQNGWGDTNFYYMFSHMFYGGYFFELLFIPLGYIVTTNVCIDVTEKVSRLFITRASTYSYIIAKYIIGIVYSFLMTIFVLNVFVAIGRGIMPSIDESYYSGGTDAYEDLLKFHDILYYEMRILFVAFVISFFVAVGMVLSVLIHNQYVSALSPYLAYIIITKLQLILRMPEYTLFSSIWSGITRTSSSVGQSIGYIILFDLSGLLFVGFVCAGVMKRRCCGEKD